MFKRVNEGEGDHQGSFVGLLSLSQPYLNYTEKLSCPKTAYIPRLAVINRWDGMFGFPGGKVDIGETPRTAAVREVKEEIGLDLSIDDLYHVSSFRKNDFTSNFYACCIDWSLMKQVPQMALAGSHNEGELSGVLLLFLTQSNIPTFRRLPWSFSSYMEFDLLLERYDMMIRPS